MTSHQTSWLSVSEHSLIPQRTVRLYAQDPEYFIEDTDVLSHLGFAVLDSRYGVHEGFAKVDERTLVLSVGNGARKLVCETTRPAAMIWSESEQSLCMRTLLASEYNKRPCGLRGGDDEYGCGCLAGMVLYVRKSRNGSVGGILSRFLSH
jgi:hypothetical protein